MWQHCSNQGVVGPAAFRLVLLVVIGFGCLVQASHEQEELGEGDGTYLEFLKRMSNYHVMRRCDDCNSDAIDLSANPVPFGEYYHLVAHVATNGLVSFGNAFTSFLPVPFSNESNPGLFIAAPYWADIDNRFSGEIWYETHTAGSGENSTESNALLEEVSAFITTRQNIPSFNGSWMLVATWNESFPFGGRNLSEIEHNTFQAIVITNGTKTYTVFTYHCDDLNWANGNRTVIGFNAGGTSYENHPFSGTPDASDIDCESYPPSLWNNIVYDVNPLGSNSSITSPPGGSCLDAGFTECCVGSVSTCLGTPTRNCYCDRNCHIVGDCCDDIDEICPGPTELQPGNETFLVVTNALSVLHISIDGSTFGNLVPLTFAFYLAIDYDYRQRYIYFSNLLTSTISRVTFDRSSSEVVFASSSRKYIEDLAVDWIANNLYWTDTLNRRLEVLDINSTYYVTELLQTGLHTAPRAIVVDPSTRYMYWSDWGEPAKIERASMDGSDRKVLHDTDLTWPNGLTIDYQLQRLYWADAFTDRIEYSSVDGTGREILLTSAHGLQHPFGITVSGNQIYWADVVNGSVYTTHKQAAVSIVKVYDQFVFASPRAIEAVDPNRQSTNITNYCEGSPCSHLCLLSASSPTNYTCACPEGSSLMEDGISCTEVTNVTIAPPLQGSCIAAGYTDCCTGGYCSGSPPTCYCEPDCEIFGDCCDDFRTICIRPTTEPTSTTATTSAPPTTTAAPTTIVPGTEPPTKQAYLEFVERTSNYRVMRRCDDCNSDAIDLSTDPVPFGEYYHLVAHVATNGLVSFGNAFTSFLPVPFSNESNPGSFIAAPYWADIDNSVSGEIWYEIHTAGSGENSTESNALLEEVSAFITTRQNIPSFNGSWMLVATWNESFPFGGRNLSEIEHNTFQAIVITNGTKTYTVFTYHCDDLNWANGNRTVIGFNAGGTSYENHPFSGTPDASDIDCESYPPSLWNNIVYDVNPLGSNSSISPRTGGSCLDAGFTECCVGSVGTCLGTPTRNCYCDRNCHIVGDCCDDIDEICPGPTELQPGNETFLVVTNALSVVHFGVDGSTFGNLVPVTFAFYLAIDYDYRQNYIYFSNLLTSTISRVTFDGSSSEVVFASSSRKFIEDLAMDWIANNLYWTDTLNRKLEVLDINSTYYVTELLQTGLHTAPRAIVVDPSTRYMYWSDWGEPAKIERASMDGSDRKVLHDTDLTWPNGLTIDYQLQRLYWADAFTDRIEYSSVDGTGREILLTSAHGLQHPFGITISGNQIYWVDVVNGSVYTTHKQAAVNIVKVYDEFVFAPRAIEAVDPNRQSTNITNYCEGNPCSHLCLLSASSPTNYTCACPEGSSLMEDGISCTEVTNVTIAPPLQGSCIAAGYTDCCTGGYCSGSPPTCYCEPDCEIFGDCCEDFRTICIRPTTEPTSTTATTSAPPTTTAAPTTIVPGTEPPTEQAYLEFVERTSNYRVMRRCDDCNSDAIDLSADPVPFGEYYHLVAHVATNGLVSFGNTFISFLPVPFSNESNPGSFIAAPYWADIDNSVSGEIWYETHTAESGENSTESNALLEEVSAFVTTRQNIPSFNGSWMLVATWNESFPFSGRNLSELEHNTFQAIVITNGTKTYTVFTYHCDDLNWANGNRTVIGFNAGGTSYENHPFSGTPDASDIDCESYPSSLWNNLVYDVNPLGSNINNTVPTAGSCLAAGYTECCSDLLCLGAPTRDCYCDPGCHRFDDCCHDIDQTCSRNTSQGDDTFLIVANRITVYRMNIDGTLAGVAIQFDFSSSYLGIDYHYGQQYIYFSDVLGARIRRVEFNETTPETIIDTPLQSIEDLAVDWIANNLYWTDTIGRKLEVYNLDSNYEATLLQSSAHSAPKAIVVDPSTRYMYWTDWGEPAMIERASMDGSDRKVLHNTGLTWPNGLAIDYQLQRLYWADAFTDRIEYSSVDGTGREILLTVASGLHHPFSITISGDQVYWTDWTNLTVYTAHKQAATTILPVFSGFLLLPYGIEAVDPNRQSTNITNYCEGSPCSHLCLLSASSPTNYTCACPEGSSLMDDGMNCTEITNVTTTPLQRGSCAAAGFTDCCEGGYCAGYPATCYCEPDCETFRDCCDDFRTICAAPTTIPPPNITTLIQPTAISSSTVPSTTTESPTVQVKYLEFLERTSNYHIMRRCDDCNSDAIDLSANPVPFGEYYHLVAHVATNGLISFGNTFTSFTPIPFSNESSPAIIASTFLAAPYWADIDNSVSGEIWYETHTARSGENSTESNALLEEVSTFIRVRQDLSSFSGLWMLVATWNESFPFGFGFNNVSEHNTFQAIVITNLTKTYTVFTYHCDDLNWANGNRTVIGFNAGGTSYENHPFSGTPDASDIDCESYPPSLWNNLVYDVNPLGSNSSVLPPLEGSCLDAGYTECCNDGFCAGVPTFSCFCDSTCHGFGDCCSDIEQICPRSSTVGNETFLIVANSITIFKISTDGSLSIPLLPVNVSKSYLALDFDYRNQYVYYSDLFGQSLIGRVRFNGSNPESLLVAGIDLQFVEDLAVDWIANNLYWTDTLNRRLEVLDIDSEYRTELLRTGAHSAPRAIVVDPSTRYMYWSDWGEPAMIERASTDGSDRKVLHNTGLTWPNGLAIDYQLQRLYWADAFTDRIEYSSVDGIGREILLTVASGLHHPFSITISGDQVYWTDWANFTVYTAHKQAAISILPVYTNFILAPNGIEAVDPNRQQTDITNYCEGSPCSHLCLLSASSPTNYTCACPEGSSLMENGVSCTEVTNVTTRPPQRGSCAAAGYTECCTGGYCAGYPPNCYCEPDCELFGDCCNDFKTICLPPSNSSVPLSTPAPTISATTATSVSLRSTATTEVKTSPTSATPIPSIIPTSATSTATTEEPTEDITVFSSRKINGGVVAGALIVVILTLILIVVIILGVVWIIKKKKVKESYGLFESDTESYTGSTHGTFGELRPRLDSYEQKENLGKEAVSYETGTEKIHFKLKPNSFALLEPDDAL